jgi:hypothetical protein
MTSPVRKSAGLSQVKYEKLLAKIAVDPSCKMR